MGRKYEIGWNTRIWTTCLSKLVLSMHCFDRTTCTTKMIQWMCTMAVGGCLTETKNTGSYENGYYLVSSVMSLLLLFYKQKLSCKILHWQRKNFIVTKSHPALIKTIRTTEVWGHTGCAVKYYTYLKIHPQWKIPK